MEDKTITIFLGDEEKTLKVLFTYHNDQRNADYILVYEEDNPEDVMLFQYFEDNTLAPVEDETIFEEAQELLDTFDAENLDEEEVPEI